MRAWLDKAGPYRIERLPMPYLNEPIQGIGTGVVHTTEGPRASALAVFRQHFAPHFTVDAGWIGQHVPLGKVATSLEHPPGTPETNRVARVQIEVVGHSRQSPYSFPQATEDTLAWLMYTLEQEAGIPLEHPFPEAMPPQPWATPSFPRRHAGKLNVVPGWYGHVEVPNNAHWDPGALKWTALIDLAKSHAPVSEQYVYDLSIRLPDSPALVKFTGVKYPGSVLKKYGISDHKVVEFWGRRRKV